MSKEPQFQLIEWRTGTPPHIGWWMASRTGESGIWRWWDGAFWSLAANDFDSAELAGSLAAHIDLSEDVKWSVFYPANARVPRIEVRFTPPEFATFCRLTTSRASERELTELMLEFIDMAEYCYPSAARALRARLGKDSP